jgi:LysM repeat protein
MRRIFLLIIAIIFVAVLIINGQDQSVLAQSDLATSLINTVNTLRANNSLAAYEIDASLMEIAQNQAEYMAEVGQITHTRADGSTPSTLGFSENIAGGANLTVQVVVYSMWTDSDNWSTMVGFRFGKIGAGVVEQDGNYYYVLVVEETQLGLAAQPTINYQITADPNLVSDVITATPQQDGSIIHEVQDGQSLWAIAIAYNITINDIISWNNLLPTPVIFVGERLVVQIAPTPTLSPTVTKTSIPPTRTIRPSQTPVTPKPTASVTPTPLPTERPPFSIYEMERSQRVTIGLGMAIICLVGLIIVIIRGFLRQ